MLSDRNKSAPTLGTLTAALTTIKKALFANIFFGFFINLALFASPLYMMQIYNRVLPSRSLPTLVMLTGLGVFRARRARRARGDARQDHGAAWARGSRVI